MVPVVPAATRAVRLGWQAGTELWQTDRLWASVAECASAFAESLRLPHWQSGTAGLAGSAGSFAVVVKFSWVQPVRVGPQRLLGRVSVGKRIMPEHCARQLPAGGMPCGCVAASHWHWQDSYCVREDTRMAGGDAGFT